MKWDGDQWRRWNGRKWVTAAYSADPERLKDPGLMRTREGGQVLRPTPGQCKHLLTLAVEDQVVDNRARVVFEGPHGTVLAYPTPIHHGLHAVLSVLTGGLWLAIWLFRVFAVSAQRVRPEVDEWGDVWATALRRR